LQNKPADRLPRLSTGRTNIGTLDAAFWCVLRDASLRDAPQHEDHWECSKTLNLILRSERSERLEGRTALLQGAGLGKQSTTEEA
jgi:hypothetical protein